MDRATYHRIKGLVGLFLVLLIILLFSVNFIPEWRVILLIAAALSFILAVAVDSCIHWNDPGPKNNHEVNEN